MLLTLDVHCATTCEQQCQTIGELSIFTYIGPREVDRIKTIFRTLSKAAGSTQWAYPSTHQNGWPDSMTLKLS